MSEQRLTHLLRPREWRVWCRPNDDPGNLDVTTKPSKVTCANCLTSFRSKTQKRYNRFLVSHTHPSRKLSDLSL